MQRHVPQRGIHLVPTDAEDPADEAQQQPQAQSDQRQLQQKLQQPGILYVFGKAHGNGSLLSGGMQGGEPSADPLILS